MSGPRAATLRCVEEGLFHADDLATWRPRQFAVLARYAKRRRAVVEPGADGTIKLMTRRAFLDDVFWPLAYQSRALVVGFNLPFDLSRIADAAAEGRYPHRGSFSFRFWSYMDADGKQRERVFRPRVRVESLDGVGAFISFAHPRFDKEKPEAPLFTGHFLDARTLAFVVSGEVYRLEHACDAFGVTHGKMKTAEHGTITARYIDYCRRDVAATAELLEKLRAEFDRHPVPLKPWKAYSPASIAKAYLRAMGIRIPKAARTGVGKKAVSLCMNAYFGGRAECRIRHTAVPVVTVDFTSMYPTVATLLGTPDLLTADHIDVVDDTDGVRELLTRVTADACFDPAFWRKLALVAEVVPDGDILPMRGRYDPHDRNFQIGVNAVSSSRPVPYMGPDLVASVLLSGKVPHIQRAYRFVPCGRQAGLAPVRLSGRALLDPASGNIFRVMVEERARVKADLAIPEAERERIAQGIKIVANGGAYGIHAEINPDETPKDRSASIRVHGLDRVFDSATKAPEVQGKFFFPPLAALVPSGARLMLALLETQVTARGGTYAFADTDSMAIVSTKRGGRVPCSDQANGSAGATVTALSWADVDDIVAQFARLNPYDQSIIPGSILKVEARNFANGRQRQLHAYVISAKRYALFTRRNNDVVVVKPSEHGLGHLLNPIDPERQDRDWIADLWRYLIRRALGYRPRPPQWLNRPAVSKVAINTPVSWRPFHGAAQGRSYSECVKPFGFLIAAHVNFVDRPTGADPEGFHLVAPYEPDATRWFDIPWTDLHTGSEYGVTASPSIAPELVRVQSIAEVVATFWAHPEPKSADAVGIPCACDTRGLLYRRHIRIGPIRYIGKEANRIEDVIAGLVHRLEDVLLMTDDPEAELWRESAKVLATRHRVSIRTIRSWRSKCKR